MAQANKEGTMNKLIAITFAVFAGLSFTEAAVQSKSLAPSKIVVPAAGNQVGLTITQNDSSKVGLQVSSVIYSSAGGFKFPDGSVQVSASSGTASSSGTTWTAFTPTMAGLGSITATHFVYSIDSHRTLRIKGNGTAGTVSAVAMTLTLPDGLLIDYTKEATSASGHKVGEVVYVNSGAATNLYTGSYIATAFQDGTTTDKIFFGFTVGASVYTKNNGNSLIASNGYFDLNIEVIVQ